MLILGYSAPQFKRSDPNFAADVYGLMTIATKYLVDTICSAVVRHLKEEWPQTLGELIRQKDDIQIKSASWERYVDSNKYRTFPEPASAIQLAADFDIPEILPIAYYVLSTRDINRSSGYLRTLWHLLRRDELLRYYQGKHKLMENITSVERIYWPDNYSGYCTTVFEESDYDNEDFEGNSSECRKIIMRVRKQRSQCLATFGFAYTTYAKADPLGSLIQLLQDSFKWKLCSACSDETQSNIRYEMKSIWMCFPETFSLSKLGALFVFILVENN